MNFISSALALLLAIAPVAVQSHSTEVAFCVTSSLNLRIFIEHWHGNLSSGSQAGTLDFTDNNAGSSSRRSLTPLGVINDVTRANLASAGGCATGITVNSECRDPYNDWVYYDFPMGTCGNPVDYKVETGSGTTVYLDDGCGGNLYPANIKQTIECPTLWPSVVPSSAPTVAETPQPSSAPTVAESSAPTVAESSQPTTTKSSKRGKVGKNKKNQRLLRAQNVDV